MSDPLPELHLTFAAPPMHEEWPGLHESLVVPDAGQERLPLHAFLRDQLLALARQWSTEPLDGEHLARVAREKLRLGLRVGLTRPPAVEPPQAAALRCTLLLHYIEAVVHLAELAATGRDQHLEICRQTLAVLRTSGRMPAALVANVPLRRAPYQQLPLPGTQPAARAMEAGQSASEVAVANLLRTDRAGAASCIQQAMRGLARAAAEAGLGAEEFATFLARRA